MINSLSNYCLARNRSTSSLLGMDCAAPALVTANAEAAQPRSKATSVNIDPSNITPEQLQQFNQAQSGLSSALSRLLVTVERYPDIKANQNFLELQSQLEGTENRINVARDRFNEAIEPYNKHVKRFPNSILAGIFNFDPMDYYKAEAGSEKAPDVDFDFK